MGFVLLVYIQLIMMQLSSSSTESINHYSSLSIAQLYEGYDEKQWCIWSRYLILTISSCTKRSTSITMLTRYLICIVPRCFINTLKKSVGFLKGSMKNGYDLRDPRCCDWLKTHLQSVKSQYYHHHQKHVYVIDV